MQVWNLNTGCKKSLSGCHCTTLSGCIFTIKACIDNRKKIVRQQYLRQMSSQYGELRPTNGWDRFISLGAPQQISTDFASWQHYCTALHYWASAKLCGIEQRAPPIFGRAAIKLDIVPHSSCGLFFFWLSSFFCQKLVSFGVTLSVLVYSCECKKRDTKQHSFLWSAWWINFLITHPVCVLSSVLCSRLK